VTTCLYIASTSFSGSTLLTLLVGGHPSIATVGEMKGVPQDLATYACSCGKLFTKCPFWERLIGVLAGRGFIYDLSDLKTTPAFRMPGSPLIDRFMRRAYGGAAFERFRDAVLRYAPGSARRLAYLRRYNASFIDLVLQITNASIFLDSSKDPVRVKYLANIPSLELRVVHLIRDGRGVVNSARKNAGMSVRDASIEWLHTHLEIERVTRRFCDRSVLKVHYEDLCANPDEVVATTLRFVGATEQVRVTAALNRELHVHGNRMRLKGILPIRLDESWKCELSTADLATFANIAGSLNADYGYGA